MAVGSVLLKVERLMSGLECGQLAVNFSSGGVIVSVKQLRNVHQTLKDSVTLLS